MQASFLIPCMILLLNAINIEAISMTRGFKIPTSLPMIMKASIRKISSSTFLLRKQYHNYDRQKASFSSFRRSTIQMMPEGPEVKTLIDQLQPAVGKRLVNISFLSGRYNDDTSQPVGYSNFRDSLTPYNNHHDNYNDKNISSNTNNNNKERVDIVTEWNCKGKFIYMVLDGGKHNDNKDVIVTETPENEDDYLRSIWITLGMTGRFVNENIQQQIELEYKQRNTIMNDGAKARWVLEFLDVNSKSKTPITRKIFYHDPRKFGTIRFSLSKSELNKKLDSLGTDIFDQSSFTLEHFLSILEAQKQSINICKFLMDQKKISGVGNYILSEVLYKSMIDPFASLSELSLAQRKLLYDMIKSTAYASYASQGLTRPNGGTYRDFEGKEGSYGFSLQCYGQTVCPKGRPILKDVNGPHGRTIWYIEDQLFMSRRERNLRDNNSDVNVDNMKPLPMNQEDDDNTNSNVAGDMKSHNESYSENSSSQNSLVDALIESNWKNILQPFLSSEKFENLSRFLSSERKNYTIYPPPNQVFSALNLCPFPNVKVIILGQDPYHGPGQSHGLSFSIPKQNNSNNNGNYIKPPPSLMNIFKELESDPKVTFSRPSPTYGNLESWAEQGVLLLNTVLTVRRGIANSHANMGWEDFTSEIIHSLNEQTNHELVFLCWGSAAAKKIAGVDRTRHTVICTSHPSPLGATKTDSPFLGSGCFGRCNDALIAKGMKPIDWSLH